MILSEDQSIVTKAKQIKQNNSPNTSYTPNQIPNWAYHQPWCCWQSNKIPYGIDWTSHERISGIQTKAKWECWLSFEEAFIETETGKIGISLLCSDGIGFVDVDHCRDPETNQYHSFAAHIIEIASNIGAYTEISPSGTGIKVFGTIPRLFHNNSNKLNYRNDDIGFEVYEKDRHGCITGNVIVKGNNESPANLLSIIEAIEAYCRKETNPKKEIQEVPACKDLQLTSNTKTKLAKHSIADWFRFQKRLTELMVSYGWKITGKNKSKGQIRLARPEKNDGTSAVVHNEERVKIFTTSTNVKPITYSAFGLFAELVTGGDERKAANILYAWRDATGGQGPLPLAQQSSTNGLVPINPSSNAKPTLEITKKQAETTWKALEILALDPNLFRIGKSFKAASFGHNGVEIIEVDANLMSLRLSSQAKIIKKVKNKIKLTNIDTWLPKFMLACGSEQNCPIVQVKAILDGPTIDQNGNLVNTFGKVTLDGQQYFMTGVVDGLEELIPDVVTEKHIKQSVENIWNVVQDYPWTDPQKDFHRWFLFLITTICRHSFPICPAFLITANNAGSGKSDLSHLIHIIAKGKKADAFSFEKDVRNIESDLSQTLFSAAAVGRTFVFFDNLPNGYVIRSAELDRTITEATISNRIFHTQTVKSYDVNFVIVFTGNNVTPSEDSAQRILRCNLMSQVETRRTIPTSQFKIGDAKTYAIQNHRMLLASALTVIKGWVQANKPRPKGESWGTFNEWVNTAVAISRFALDSDPIANWSDEAKASDPLDIALNSVLIHWESVLGKDWVSCSKILEVLALPNITNPDQEEFKVSLGALGPIETANHIGRTLSRFENKIRVIGGKNLRIATQIGKSKSKVYTVVQNP